MSDDVDENNPLRPTTHSLKLAMQMGKHLHGQRLDHVGQTLAWLLAHFFNLLLADDPDPAYRKRIVDGFCHNVLNRMDKLDRVITENVDTSPPS